MVRLNGLVGLIANCAPIVLLSLIAPSQAQEAGLITHVYKSISIKPHASEAKQWNWTGEGPDGLTISGETLAGMIQSAYGYYQISGGPRWLNSQQYDVLARLNKSATDKLRESAKQEVESRCFSQSNLNSLDSGWCSDPESSGYRDYIRKIWYQKMIEALLSEGFKLTLHREGDLGNETLVIDNVGFSPMQR